MAYLGAVGMNSKGEYLRIAGFLNGTVPNILIQMIVAAYGQSGGAVSIFR